MNIIISKDLNTEIENVAIEIIESGTKEKIINTDGLVLRLFENEKINENFLAICSVRGIQFQLCSS